MKELTEIFASTTVNNNAKFSIELDALDHPAFDWVLKVTSGKATVVDVAQPTENVEGAGITKIFTFKAKQKGTIEIAATYTHATDETLDRKPMLFTIKVV